MPLCRSLVFVSLRLLLDSLPAAWCLLSQFVHSLFSLFILTAALCVASDVTLPKERDQEKNKERNTALFFASSLLFVTRLDGLCHLLGPRFFRGVASQLLISISAKSHGGAYSFDLLVWACCPRCWNTFSTLANASASSSTQPKKIRVLSFSPFCTSADVASKFSFVAGPSCSASLPHLLPGALWQCFPVLRVLQVSLDGRGCLRHVDVLAHCSLVLLHKIRLDASQQVDNERPRSPTSLDSPARLAELQREEREARVSLAVLTLAGDVQARQQDCMSVNERTWQVESSHTHGSHGNVPKGSERIQQRTA